MQWHPSQRIIEENGEAVNATFELGSTVELKRWMLGFGRYARVLSPRDLADDVREEHLAAAQQGRKE